MSTTEKYVHSLKQIKEAEDRAQKAIDEQKKRVSEEFHNFEGYTTKTITATKTDGEKLIESSVEQSKKKATTETEKIVEDANNKSKTISARIDAQTVHEIIDILLKEV
jgi:V/A-type H+/Na+-transporting ATPase subunit G/H